MPFGMVLQNRKRCAEPGAENDSDTVASPLRRQVSFIVDDDDKKSTGSPSQDSSSTPAELNDCDLVGSRTRGSPQIAESPDSLNVDRLSKDIKLPDDALGDHSCAKVVSANGRGQDCHSPANEVKDERSRHSAGSSAGPHNIVQENPTFSVEAAIHAAVQAAVTEAAAAWRLLLSELQENVASKDSMINQLETRNASLSAAITALSSRVQGALCGEEKGLMGQSVESKSWGPLGPLRSTETLETLSRPKKERMQGRQVQIEPKQDGLQHGQCRNSNASTPSRARSRAGPVEQHDADPQLEAGGDLHLSSTSSPPSSPAHRGACGSYGTTYTARSTPSLPSGMPRPHSEPSEEPPPSQHAAGGVAIDAVGATLVDGEAGGGCVRDRDQGPCLCQDCRERRFLAFPALS
jgi:hypothetical protein